MNSRKTVFFASDDHKGNIILKRSIAGFAAIVALMFGILAFFVVPAPNKRTATEVSGIMASMSHPHPEYGDIEILLDNGQRYYINRANEVPHLDWEKMLAEVQPGDKVQLTVVTPLIWRILADKAKTNLPVAGIQTADTVYMDVDITASTWKSQDKYSEIAIFSLGVLLVFLLPDFLRLFKTTC